VTNWNNNNWPRILQIYDLDCRAYSNIFFTVSRSSTQLPPSLTELDHNAVESLNPKNGKCVCKSARNGRNVLWGASARSPCNTYRSLVWRLPDTSGRFPAPRPAALHSLRTACKARTLDSACVKDSTHNPKPYINYSIGVGRYLKVLRLRLLEFARRHMHI